MASGTVVPVKNKADFKKTVRIASVGFGNMASALCESFRDSGARVVVGARDRRSARAKAAKRKGFAVDGIDGAVRESDFVLLAIPDPGIAGFWKENAGTDFRGKCVVLCHGISYLYGRENFPAGCDIVMVSPNAIAGKFRENFVSGKKNYAIATVIRDVSGKSAAALKTLCALLGLKGKGVIGAPLREEVFSDLFAEQTLLVGGIVALLTSSFEVMAGKGISEKTAYVSTFHEIRYIVDTICDSGLERFLDKISPTALYGSVMALWRSGAQKEFKRLFGRIFDGIENGSFFRDFTAAMGDPAGKAELDGYVDEIKRSGLCRLYEKYGR